MRFVRYNWLAFLSPKNQGEYVNWCQIKDLIPASISRLLYDSFDARNCQEKILDDDRAILAWNFTSKSLHFLLTVFAQHVKAHAIAFRLLNVIL